MLTNHILKINLKHFLTNCSKLVQAKQSRHVHYYSATSTTPLIADTIGERLEFAAEKFENRESFVFVKTGQRLTFKTLKEKAECLAAGLIALGVSKGDRVGMWAPNCMEWILTQYATALIGAIQVNINPAYKSGELEYSLNKVGCKTLIMSETYKTQNFVETFLEICPEVLKSSSSPADLKCQKAPHLKHVVLISEKKRDGFYLFDQVLNGGDSTHLKKYHEIKTTLKSSDPINIQYTSGTTGFPKGVTLTHHMILNNAFQTSQSMDYQKRKSILCLQVPLYHCLGMVMGSLSTITHGITCVMPNPTFHPEESLKAIQQEGCTTIYGTPTMYIDMYNHPNFKKYDVSSLKSGIMTGSTCPIEIVNDCVKKLHIKDILVVYGLTETSPVITLNSVHDTLENRTQTIGRIAEHLEAKVVDSNDKIVPIGETGELLVRGYNTMIGYWNDKQKTEETYTHDRFLRTGDLVRMNKQGYFYHQGRLKDMVIRGGENIYPREIEEFLHQNPKIVDVYVVGVPDKRMVEELCACVQLVNGENMTADELKEYCKGKIAHYKVPRYVEFMQDFPKTITGKIQKNKLREMMIKKLNL